MTEHQPTPPPRRLPQGLLLAEEFVLMALAPDGRPARGVSKQSAAAVGVTGALVTELAQGGHLDLSDGRIRLTGQRPVHRLLIQALDNLAAHEGKKLKSRLGSVKNAGWSEVVDGMVQARLLGREKQPLRPTRHPIIDSSGQALLLDRIRAAATGKGPLDGRDASLLALAGPCQLLEVVAPNRSDRATAKRRITEAAEQVPAAAAVRHVIEAMNAAVIAGGAVAASSG